MHGYLLTAVFHSDYAVCRSMSNRRGASVKRDIVAKIDVLQYQITSMRPFHDSYTLSRTKNKSLHLYYQNPIQFPIGTMVNLIGEIRCWGPQDLMGDPGFSRFRVGALKKFIRFSARLCDHLTLPSNIENSFESNDL